MNNNIFFKNLIIITFICVFCCVKCLGQAAVIAYHTPNNFTVNTPITALNPIIIDSKTTYTISPKLPDGLQIEPGTGIITGTPTKASKETEYTVTAKNKNDSIKSAPIKITVVDKDASSPANANCCKVSDGKDLDFAGWILVFLPLLLFIVFLGFFLIYMNSTTLGKEFSLKEALSESGYAPIIVDNPQYNDGFLQQLIDLEKINTTTTALPVAALFTTTISKTDNKYRPSMSRLIAFLTSMLSLVIGLCLSSFFIYCYLKNGCIPDIGKLSAVLISMGIGVVPYAFNKVSSMSGNGSAK